MFVFSSSVKTANQSCIKTRRGIARQKKNPAYIPAAASNIIILENVRKFPIIYELFRLNQLHIWQLRLLLNIQLV